MYFRNKKMKDTAKYNTIIKPNWCPGCGDFMIWGGIKQVLSNLELAPHEVVITYDIGCAGNMADKLNTYGYKTLHGRTVALASGVKLGNPELTVIATGGDGGIMEEGLQHLVWAARSNYDITVILHNNLRYSLTTGQPTVLTPKGSKSKTNPYGVLEDTILPAHVALVAGAGFVARAFTGAPQQLAGLLQQGIEHKGFSFLEVLQPCVTLNKVNTLQWFKDRVYDVSTSAVGANGAKNGYDSSDKEQAFEVSKMDGSADSDCRIATGVLYEDKKSVPFYDRMKQRKGVKTMPPYESDRFDISELIKEFV